MLINQKIEHTKRHNRQRWQLFTQQFESANKNLKKKYIYDIDQHKIDIFRNFDKPLE